MEISQNKEWKGWLQNDKVQKSMVFIILGNEIKW